ncbi:MAG: ribbon-helix-helix domain-containing protein [Cyanobacteria bacterium P01_G01_bin.54]
MGRPNHSISTKVDKELLTRIDAVADKRGVSRSAVVRELILEALNIEQDPNAELVARLQQVQTQIEQLATQPPTEILAELQRLHERLENLEQQSHHQSSQLAAIPLPPPPVDSPATEPTVDLSPDELAELLEPEPSGNASTPVLDVARPSPDNSAIPKPTSHPDLEAGLAAVSMLPVQNELEPNELEPDDAIPTLDESIADADLEAGLAAVSMLPVQNELELDDAIPTLDEPAADEDLEAGLAAVSMLPVQNESEPEEQVPELTGDALDDAAAIAPDAESVPELTLDEPTTEDVRAFDSAMPDANSEQDLEAGLAAVSMLPVQREIEPDDPIDDPIAEPTWAEALEIGAMPELALDDAPAAETMTFDAELADPELDSELESIPEPVAEDRLEQLESPPIWTPVIEPSVELSELPPSGLPPSDDPDDWFDPFADAPLADEPAELGEASGAEAVPDFLETIPGLTPGQIETLKPDQPETGAIATAENTAQSEDSPMPEEEQVGELSEGTELNFDELCQYIGVNPKDLTAAAYKRDQSPISALAWRTGWKFNLITQRFTKPGATSNP